MRFIRSFIVIVIAVAVVAGLGIGLALSPTLQTWYVQRQLDQHPEWHAFVDTVSAGLHAVRITNLRIEQGGTIISVPELDAELPVRAAFWNHRFHITNLVAKDWVLELNRPLETSAAAPGSGKTAAATASSGSAPASSGRASSPSSALTATAVSAFRGVLSGLSLPEEVSIEKIDGDGAVVIYAADGGKLARIHVVAKGGRIGAGNTGEFDTSATGTVTSLNVPIPALSTQGPLKVQVGADRRIGGIVYSGMISPTESSQPAQVGFTASIQAGGAPGEESYSLDIGRGPRHVAILAANLVPAKQSFTGTWKVDVDPSDFFLFQTGGSPHAIGATGDGSFDSDLAFNVVHVNGRLASLPAQLSGILPQLDRIAGERIVGVFDFTRRASALHVDRLRLQVGMENPVLLVDASQPFTIDEHTAAPQAASPTADWLTGTFREFPLEWLPRFNGDLGVSGRLTGTVTVRRAPGGGFALVATSPLHAKAVAVRRGDTEILHNFDASLAFEATSADKGLQFHADPVSIDLNGAHVASVSFEGSTQPDPYGRFPLKGRWSANLDTLNDAAPSTGVRWWRGRSASGEFTASVGTASDLSATLKILGHDARTSVSAKLEATVDDYRTMNLRMPVTITSGTGSSDLNVEGSWTADSGAQRVDLQVSTSKITLADLRLLRRALPVATAKGTTPDLRPFWGNLVGRVRFDVRLIQDGQTDWNDLGGTLAIEPTVLTLNGGRGVWVPEHVTTIDPTKKTATEELTGSAFAAEGSLAFAARSERPYRLKVTGTLDQIDTARLLGMPVIEGKDPLIEGHWSVADTITADGGTLADALAGEQHEFRLTSKGGAFRLLKTEVAESMPDKPTPVSDALAGVGSAMGAIFGRHGNSIMAENKLSKQTEAVLNFTAQSKEFSYEVFSVTATRHPDGNIMLSDIAITAENQHITGSGDVVNSPGTPLSQRPLHLLLNLAFRGSSAKNLDTAGLLSGKKDDKGYSLFREPVHFGGSLERPNSAQWHDVLLQAALAGTAQKK